MGMEGIMKRAINVPLSEAEYKKICEICLRKGVCKGTLIKIFLNEGLPDFERENKYGIFLKYEMEPGKEYKSIQVKVEESVADKLEEYADKSRVSIRYLARRIIVPQMTKER